MCHIMIHDLWLSWPFDGDAATSSVVLLALTASTPDRPQCTLAATALLLRVCTLLHHTVCLVLSAGVELPHHSCVRLCAVTELVRKFVFFFSHCCRVLRRHQLLRCLIDVRHNAMQTVQQRARGNVSILSFVLCVS